MSDAPIQFQPGDKVEYHGQSLNVVCTRRDDGLWDQIDDSGFETTHNDKRMQSWLEQPDLYTYIPAPTLAPDAPALFVEVQSEVALPENFQLNLEPDGAGGDRWFFQVAAYVADVDTGEMGWHKGGKAYLSEHAVLSELVQTAFGLYKSFLEHEARETFLWRGRRVFGPHIDVRAQWAIANALDVR